MSKGQAAPILILGILILIALSTYFLPVSEKCKLIPSLPECKITEKKIALEITPHLLQEQETAAAYALNDVQLFRKETVDVATVFESTEVKKSWFTSSAKQTTMEVQEKAREAKLFVFVNKGSGRLKIYINKEKAGSVKGEGVHEIMLDIRDLNTTNTIKIVPSTPLLPFLSNKYEVGKIVLKEDYIITHNRIPVNFSIQENKDDILDISLSFRTHCFTDDNLSIYMNNEKVFEDLVCTGVDKDITNSVFKANMSGEIVFASEGNYVIDEIRLNVRMKERTWPKYYFTVSEESLDNPIMLKIGFNEPGIKKLTAYINGGSISVETAKKEWQTVINKYLEEGTNSLILIPEQTLFISNLKIE